MLSYLKIQEEPIAFFDRAEGLFKGDAFNNFVKSLHAAGKFGL